MTFLVDRVPSVRRWASFCALYHIEQSCRLAEQVGVYLDVLRGCYITLLQHCYNLYEQIRTTLQIKQNAMISVIILCK